jgi:hypothetical protein
MKKQRRRPYQRQSAPRPQVLLFTLEQLVFLRKALVPLKQMILTNTSSLPNVQFALETVNELHIKIDFMIHQGEWGECVPFDANEVLILRTAVWLFKAALDEIAPSLEGEQPKTMCKKLLLLLTIHKNVHD